MTFTQYTGSCIWATTSLLIPWSFRDVSVESRFNKFPRTSFQSLVEVYDETVIINVFYSLNICNVSLILSLIKAMGYKNVLPCFLGKSCVACIDPDSKVYGANMGSTWGRQDPVGPHVGPMNLAIWGFTLLRASIAEVVSMTSNV